MRIALIVSIPAIAGSPILAQGIGQSMEDYLVRGQTLLAHQRPNEAIVQFQEVRALCPNPFQMVTSLIGEARARLELNELLPAAGLLEEAALATRSGRALRRALPAAQSLPNHGPQAA